MELFTLSPAFLRQDLVEDYSSLIWTERYVEPGEVNLIVPDIPGRQYELRPGVLLGLSDSKEVMRISTQSVDQGIITIKGYSLDRLFNGRYIRSTTSTDSELSQAPWVVTPPTSPMSPAAVMGQIVEKMCMAGPHLTAMGPAMTKQAIPNLHIGSLDTAASWYSAYAFSFAQNSNVAETLKSIAASNGLGISLYLESASDAGYDLRFKVYRGANRTNWPPNPSRTGLVRFASELDSLVNVKRLESYEDFISGVHVWVTSYVPYNPGTWKNPIEVTGLSASGLDLSFAVTNLDETEIPGTLSGDDDRVRDKARRMGQEILAQHTRQRITDGEASGFGPFQFGRDYNLGDCVELNSSDEFARITEYVRSYDTSGKREWPTLVWLDRDELPA